MWDPISAISAALGVAVATVLGLLAVRIASRTITRSELEYRAERADRVLEKAAQITTLSGESKAALHAFWKEPFADVRKWWADVELGDADNDALVAARFAWLMDERGSGERRAHEVDYALSGAAGEFRALVHSTGVGTAESLRLFALLDVLRGSVRTQYLALVQDVPWGIAPSATNYSEEILTAMANEIVTRIPKGEEAVKHSVIEWFTTYLRDNRLIVSPAAVATEFHEAFVEPLWARECSELVAPFHQRALTT